MSTSCDVPWTLRSGEGGSWTCEASMATAAQSAGGPRESIWTSPPTAPTATTGCRTISREAWICRGMAFCSHLQENLAKPAKIGRCANRLGDVAAAVWERENRKNSQAFYLRKREIKLLMKGVPEGRIRTSRGFCRFHKRFLKQAPLDRFWRTKRCPPNAGRAPSLATGYATATKPHVLFGLALVGGGADLEKKKPALAGGLAPPRSALGGSTL